MSAAIRASSNFLSNSLRVVMLETLKNIKSKIEAKLRLLADDLYNPILRCHKLKGKLSGAWAFSVEYDCRIIFNFESNPETQEEDINLIDIGTHDEVY